MASVFDPFQEMERLFQGAPNSPRSMPIDLYREADHYILTADLPGIDPSSIDVDLDGQQLTIRAERSTVNAEGAKWLVRERNGGSYLRQFTLGQGLDTERIAASYEHGVLTVTVPVSERAKPRKIEVETGTKVEAVETIQA